MDEQRWIPFGVVFVFLLLLLAACAETPEPTSPAPTPTVTPMQAAPVAVAATVSITAVPLDMQPTEPPASRSASIPAESLWPCFLRELDLGIPMGNSYSPRALAVHPGLGRLYARTQSRDPNFREMGQVTMLDRGSGEVLAVVQTGLDSYSEGTLVVDPVRDRVYAHNPGQNSISVLDAGTLDEVTTLDGVNQLALDVEEGRLYVAGLTSLRALDVDGYGELAATTLNPARGFVALAAAPGGGRVHLITEEADGYLLTQFDAANLTPLASTALPARSPQAGRLEALLADPNRDRVYLALNDGERNLFWTLDGNGRVLDEQTLGEWTQRTYLALDPDGDRLFLGRDVYGDYGLTVLDLATGQEAGDIPLKQSLGALAWDADARQLFVSHTYADRIGVVDIEAEQVRAVYPTALDLVDLAVDPDRGHLLVTDSAGRLRVLNSETDALLATLPGEGRISVDGPHTRFYTGGEGADRVRVFDAAALAQTGEIQSSAKPVADPYLGGLYLVRSGVFIASLETMTVTAAISDTLPQFPNYSPNPAAVDAVVDPGSGRLFAIINNGTPGSNNGNYLYVYEPLTYQKTLTDTERSPIYVDVDPDTGRAYVSRTHLAGRSTSLLTKGREYTARLDAVFGGLKVDPDLGRVYLSARGEREGHLLVLDAANLDVLGSVPIPGNFMLRALDPQRHLLYLATEGGRVQVWSATACTLQGMGESLPPVEPEQADLASEDIFGLWRAPGDRTIFTGSLYQSDDEGASWFYLGTGLPQRGMWKLVASPDFDRDQTLFAVLTATDEGLGIWKSTDAGRSWRMVNAGLSDLSVIDLALSSGFAQDQTLFATARKQGLFRSTDTLKGTGGGETWTRLTERYYPRTDYTEPPGVLALSPTYEQDQTLFVAQDGLQRSTTTGETWTRVWPQNPESLALSPAFAQDETLFGWFGDGGLLRSTDSGQTWQPASTGLALASFGYGRVLVAPDFSTSRTVYFIWNPGPSDLPDQFHRSTDSGETWQQLAGDPPHGATPVELSASGDAFLALDGAGRLIRWPVAELDWQPVSLPPLSEIAVDSLTLSPAFPTDQTLVAVSEGAGVLRSSNTLKGTGAGQTWTDTAFPLRLTYGRPAEPVFVTAEALFVGTPLGLYRSDSGGPWALVGNGLPQGVAVSSPVIGADGSLHVFVGEEGDGTATRVFLSQDDGQTWAQALPDLPFAVLPEDMLFSPAFATDRAAFLAVSWKTPQRSLGGGDWEPFGPPGEWTLSELEISPAFDRDGLLLMRLQDNSLWRSTDNGDTWTKLSVPWGDEAPRSVSYPGSYHIGAVTFSPDYAQDGVLLAQAGGVVYRSTDTLKGTGQSQTWQNILDVEPGQVRAAFAPDYADSGVIYLLQGDALFRSDDRGATWEALPRPPWTTTDETWLQLSPTWPQDNTLLAWTLAGGVYESSGGGRSWREASAGLPPAVIRQVVFSPEHAADGLVFLVSNEGGLYKRVGGGPWLPITEAPPPPTPTDQPTPVPPPTVTPQPCAREPERFRQVWQQARKRLGCPLGAAEQLFLAEQPFEQGVMIWDSSTSQVHVLFSSGAWQTFDDTWSPDQPESDPGLVPPTGRVQPKRGFGKVWREQLGGPQSVLGWALSEERSVNGWRQPFERGLLIWTDATLGEASAGVAYLLYEDGAWQAVPAPGP